MTASQDRPVKVHVYCRSGVVRLGGRRDGCKWSGYRNGLHWSERACPRCGSPVATPGTLR